MLEGVVSRSGCSATFNFFTGGLRTTLLRLAVPAEAASACASGSLALRAMGTTRGGDETSVLWQYRYLQIHRQS
jgi:hypothetical protein